MRDALRLLPVIVRHWLSTRAQLQLEILALRHQLNVLQREQDRRPRFTSFDRIFWVWLYRLWPGCLDALAIMKPETVVRWHREGFRKYWTWTSRVRGCASSSRGNRSCCRINCRTDRGKFVSGQMSLNVRVGSTTDHRHRHTESPHLEVQLTKVQKSGSSVANVGSRG